MIDAIDGIEKALDHLVYAVPDLALAVRDLAERFGVEPVEGGRHAGLGTRNYLLGLGGSAYLEIVGPDVDQPAPDRPRPFGLDTLAAPRLLTWAVRPADLNDVVIRARSFGHDPGPVLPMSRRTPAGQLLRWRLTPISDGGPQSGGGLWPFLIDWGDAPHPTSTGLPELRLVSLTAQHPEVAVTRIGLSALGVRLDVTAGETPRLVAVVAGRHGEVSLD